MATAAGEAEKNFSEVASLVTSDRKRLLSPAKASPTRYRLFKMLPAMQRVTTERVRQQLGSRFSTVTAAVKVLENLDIAVEMTGQKKNRSHSYQTYVELLSK
jgi:hypothetical protein